MDAVSVRGFGEGERGKVSEFGGSFGAFGFVDFLLRDFGAGEIDSCAVVAMSVELSAFAGGDDYVHDDYRIVPEHDFVERLVFDGHRSLLRDEHGGHEEQRGDADFHDEGSSRALYAE